MSNFLGFFIFTKVLTKHSLEGSASLSNILHTTVSFSSSYNCYINQIRSNLVMPNGDRQDGFFYPTLTLIIDFQLYNLNLRNKISKSWFPIFFIKLENDALKIQTAGRNSRQNCKYIVHKYPSNVSQLQLGLYTCLIVHRRIFL